MKKIFVLLILTALLLSACGEDAIPMEPYTVTVDNWGDPVTLTVNPVQQTIVHKDVLYRYTIEEDEIITILYPDGASFTRFSQEDQGGYFYPDMSAEEILNREYLDGELLTRVVSAQLPQTRPVTAVNVETLIAGILVILLGVAEIRRPDLVWNLRHGFVYDAPEFSDFAIAVNRVSGGLLIFGGLILAIFGFIQ